MSILEHLAKFSPNSVNFQYSGKSSTHGLTAFDIAACASHMSEPAYHFANWYVNQDNDSRQELKKYLLRRTQQMAHSENWHARDNLALLEKFCEAALTEWENPYHCKSCKGSGATITDICQKCMGSGRKPLAKKMLASICGVSYGNWKRVWSRKYAVIYSVIAECQDRAEKSLQKDLRIASTNHLVD